uniref:Ricin B-type lectin domain-containing protein n=1 Tax=Ascaris lumbricoides TaxID=6252 RepID=A0A0M3HR58_ASCLU
MLVPAPFAEEEDTVLGINELDACQEREEQMMQAMQAQEKDCGSSSRGSAYTVTEEPQGKNFLLPGWDNGPNHLNITAAVGDLPIEARTKLCNGRGGLNMLEAGKLQRATNYAYDVRLDAPGNSQRFDTKNQPGCSDTINNPQQWREVDIMTGSGGNADNHRSGKT